MPPDQKWSSGPAMTLPAALSGFVLFILLTHMVQSLSGWGVTYSPDKVCAVEGATVELTCTYKYPSRDYYRVIKSFWFIREHYGEPLDLKDDPQFANRVLYSDENRRVRITNVTKSDSAVYKFRFITNKDSRGSYTGASGVTLSVTDLQVKSSYRSWYKWITLTCVSSCPAPQPASYIWYKDGQKIPAATSNSHTDHSDHSYSCALKDFESFPSAPACGRESQCNTVTYTVRSICAPFGSSVDISCTHSRHEVITSKFWFSPEHRERWTNREHPEDLREDSQCAGRVQVSYDSWNRRYTLKITDLRENDTAEYRFKYRTSKIEWGNDLHGTMLTVTDLQVQVKRIRDYQYSTEVELKCLCSCCEAEGLSYIWFKNTARIPGADKSTYHNHFYHEDKISCALKGHDRFPSPSVYAPKTPSVQLNAPAVVLENSVTLTCSTDANPAARFTWFKKNERGHFQHFSNEEQLVFSSVKLSDAGQYHCSAENEFSLKTSEPVTIDVKYAPKAPSVSLSPESGKVSEGGSVTLTCSSDANPPATYTWYKTNQTAPRRLQGLYHINTISSEDRGTYYCTSKNDYGQINSSAVFIDVQYAPKPPSVSLSPSGKVIEGGSVTLTCSSDANPPATYTWYKMNQTAPQEIQGLYHINNISSEDRGMYFCTSKNNYGQINSSAVFIDVQYGPKVPAVSVSPEGSITEDHPVTLTCKSDANPAASITWYKDNQTLSQGQRDIYYFSAVKSKDSGVYFCETKNQYGQKSSKRLALDVQYSPRLPIVSQNPSVKIMEGSRVDLNCSSDANPAAVYTWYKRDNRDTPVASGQTLTIRGIKVKDSGNYYCQAHNSIGSNNSALHSVVVSASMKSVAAGSVTAVILVLIVLLIFLYVRKKRSSKETNTPRERAEIQRQAIESSVNENSSDSTQRQPADEQDLCYASVRFAKNQDDPIYSNVVQAKSNKPQNKEEEDDYDVEYTMVNFKRGGATSESRYQAALEDASALYSAVARKPRV